MDATDWYHGPARDLVAVADEAWAHQVSRRDPRFADLLPKVDATVAEIAPHGTIDDRKALLRNLPLLQDRECQKDGVTACWSEMLSRCGLAERNRQ